MTLLLLLLKLKLLLDACEAEAARVQIVTTSALSRKQLNSSYNRICLSSSIDPGPLESLLKG